ncbi:hypothetical protein HK102_009074, partial [Quaeritorhiza haematococci]
TRDWEHSAPTPENVELSLQAYRSALASGTPTQSSFIALEHDPQPVTGATDFVSRAVDLVRAAGYRLAGKGGAG